MMTGNRDEAVEGCLRLDCRGHGTIYGLRLDELNGERLNRNAATYCTGKQRQTRASEGFKPACRVCDCTPYRKTAVACGTFEWVGAVRSWVGSRLHNQKILCRPKQERARRAAIQRKIASRRTGLDVVTVTCEIGAHRQCRRERTNLARRSEADGRGPSTLRGNPRYWLAHCRR